jgi:hypothetical protein
MIKLENNQIIETILTRVEIIDNRGRRFISWEENNQIDISLQDDGRTLKIFVNSKSE